MTSGRAFGYPLPAAALGWGTRRGSRGQGRRGMAPLEVPHRSSTVSDQRGCRGQFVRAVYRVQIVARWSTLLFFGLGSRPASAGPEAVWGDVLFVGARWAGMGCTGRAVVVGVLAAQVLMLRVLAEVDPNGVADRSPGSGSAPWGGGGRGTTPRISIILNPVRVPQRVAWRRHHGEAAWTYCGTPLGFSGEVRGDERNGRGRHPGCASRPWDLICFPSGNLWPPCGPAATKRATSKRAGEGTASRALPDSSGPSIYRWPVRNLETCGQPLGGVRDPRPTTRQLTLDDPLVELLHC